MNILVLSNCPTVESQGSGYVIVNTAKSLRDLGHQVEIITPDKLDFLPSWKSRARNYRMTLGMGKWVYNNRKKVAGYNLIIFYGAECAFAVFVLKKILKLSIPVILHSNGLEVHGSQQMKGLMEATDALSWYHFDQSWIFRYCYRNVDAIINVSKFEHDFAIESLRIPSHKVHYLEPCLPADFFEFHSPETLVRKPIIAYCGTWIARKGVNVIKEIIPNALRKFPAYTFRIIGTGKEFKPAEHFPEDILHRIELFPFVENKQRMIELYSEVSIFLFPSVYESFGLVVAEAMFCGCASVCGNTGFAASLKNGEEAILIKEPDASKVNHALEQVLTNDHLREKLSVNGKKRTSRLQWSNYTVQLGSILNQIFPAGKLQPAQNKTVASQPVVTV